jgi:hypothetical protein
MRGIEKIEAQSAAKNPSMHAVIIEFPLFERRSEGLDKWRAQHRSYGFRQLGLLNFFTAALLSCHKRNHA